MITQVTNMALIFALEQIALIMTSQIISKIEKLYSRA